MLIFNKNNIDEVRDFARYLKEYRPRFYKELQKKGDVISNIRRYMDTLVMKQMDIRDEIFQDLMDRIPNGNSTMTRIQQLDKAEQMAFDTISKEAYQREIK